MTNDVLDPTALEGFIRAEFNIKLAFHECAPDEFGKFTDFTARELEYAANSLSSTGDSEEAQALLKLRYAPALSPFFEGDMKLVEACSRVSAIRDAALTFSRAIRELRETPDE